MKTPLNSALTMQAIEIDYLVWREDEYCVAQCLNVELSSFGSTEQEAIEQLKDAVRLYLQDDDDIPAADKIAHFAPKRFLSIGHELLYA